MTFTGTQHGWAAPDGEAFSYSRWAPADGPRAIVIAVHGLGGAALDFDPLGVALMPHGVVTLAPELRGQGNDPDTARRGDLGSLQEWFADITAFLALARVAYPGRPLFLYGESMGAALLVRYLAQAPAVGREVGGLILASPVVAIPREPAAWQMVVFRFLLWLRPGFRINVAKLAKPKRGTPPAYVTRNEAHREWYARAPHRLPAFSIRFFRWLHELIAGCFASAPALRLPVLVLYARHDVFIRPERIEDFFALLPGPDKEMQLFPESYHLLLHDHDRALVLARIEAWLLPRLPARA